MRYHRAMSLPPARRDEAAMHGAMLREAKLALRRLVLARRDALTPEFRAAASAAIAARLAALPEIAAASVVLLTLPFRSEWDTLGLVRAAIRAGQTVALPRVDPQARMLVLHALADPDHDIAVGHQGIPEPLPDRPRVPYDAVDFVLVPGVAFDATGRRLGYGGGYYDRLLPLLRPGAARAAGAFELQLADIVPAAPHDIAVDMIVTESRTLALRE